MGVKKPKKLKMSKDLKLMSWIHIGCQVRTPDGVGIVLIIETPGNGLYYELNRTNFLVWYGCGDDHEHTAWESENSKYISQWYRAHELKPF